jgi:NTP pyrophosphatase (non-canonical NTP hydrolase)
MTREEFIANMRRENSRALAKHGEQPDITQAGWFVILTEEVGELAQAIVEGNAPRHIADEAAQVAAMAYRVAAAAMAGAADGMRDE